MAGPIELFCPACSHEWKDHRYEIDEYCYYGSKETYTSASVYCKACGGEEGEVMCLVEA